MLYTMLVKNWFSSMVSKYKYILELAKTLKEECKEKGKTITFIEHMLYVGYSGKFSEFITLFDLHKSFVRFTVGSHLQIKS